MKLKSTSRFFVNNYFSNYFNLNYPNFIIIYTDGSVSPLSAGYSFFIPELHVSFSNNLPPSSSSFTAECCAILEALLFISNLAPNNYLIASDSMSCLQSLISNPFNSKLSPIVFQIKSYLYYLNQSNRLIQLIWIPSHIGIYGNEIADGLAKATSNTILPSPAQIPWTDFSPLLRLHITCLWSNHWNNLPAYFASKYKTIVPTISNKKTWFYNLDLPRSSIVRFNRLRITIMTSKKQPNIQSFFKSTTNVLPTQEKLDNIQNKTDSVVLISDTNSPTSSVSHINRHDIFNYVKRVLTQNEIHDILNSIWIPDVNYNFPVKIFIVGKDKTTKRLKFQYKWFASFPWLVYSDIDNGAYCKFCVAFSTNYAGINNQTLGSLVTKKYDNWKHALEYFKNHSQLEYHKKCILDSENFLNIIKKKSHFISRQTN
ncbi:hypothetical protein QTP88_005859 [Uroleucon formosanum]